jgi:hypothetical protein
MLEAMATDTSTTRQVYRQRSSLALSAVCGATGLLLLLSLVRNWAQYPRPLFAAWVLLGLAFAWAIFLRPAVLLDGAGVTLRNIVRDVHIPWTLLTQVECRWNLKVYAGDKGYTAWAISSQPERPKRAPGGFFGMPVPGRLEGVASAQAKSSATVPKVSAQGIAASIRVAKQEYDDAVAHRQRPAAPDATVRIAWVPLVLAALLLPAVAVVVLSLT